MRVLIIADLEGIIGVTHLQDKKHCENCFRKELRVYVDCLKEMYDGVTITICDCHNSGETIVAVRESFFDCNVVSCLWNIDFHVTYNFAILVGFHAMSLRPCAFSHSFRPEIRRVRLGDRDVGEASLISNYLFSKSIPVLFVSGDDECIREMNSIPCGKFSTSKGLKEVMYERLAKSLRASIQKSSLFCGYHDDKVRLDFFNPDLIPILVMKGYNNDEKGSIYFENTSLFFSGIRDFCHELNKCSALLYRRNFELLKEFAGRYGKANVFAACQTHDKSLLREDIAMISHDTLKTALTSLVVHENGVKV